MRYSANFSLFFVFIWSTADDGRVLPCRIVLIFKKKDLLSPGLA
jgi:hypothetical protein